MRESTGLRKDITFIYSDSAERAIYGPLVEEARRRGYETTLTDDPFARCEIGFYCQHTNHPQYSRFSLIMLHDIIQQYGNWPDIWYHEPWDKYDVGFLPSTQWVENWGQCSQWAYARPRRGMYLAGWPKADIVNELSSPEARAELSERSGIDPSRRTVLYAPAWENDGKQDDFVRAMDGLGVNVLVKQWDADPGHFPAQVENVRRMAELHAGREGVTILPPETNIFTAIAIADVLVSEESSTMCEAAMMHVPAVSVSDWLIPDVTPSRYPKCDYTFVTRTTKEELRGCVSNMLENYDEARAEVTAFADANFSNVGTTSALMMDVIDDCVAGVPVRYEAIAPRPAQRKEPAADLQRQLMQLRREFGTNYSKQYPVVGAVWNSARAARDLLRGVRGGTK